MRDHDVNRRRLLTGGALAAAGAALGACGGDSAPAEAPSQIETASNRTKTVRELRMVTTWPKNFPGLGTMAERVAEQVELLSGGALRVKVYADGEVVPALQAFDAVSSGAADMYHGAEYYWQGKSPAFAFFTSVPMGLTATEMMGWIDYGGGQALWQALSRRFNIIAFPAGNSGHQMGGWFKREINSLDDFKGLKMRIPGLGGEVVRQLGGAAVLVPGSEIFANLQSGAIDAAEWVGPWNDLAFGFHKAAPFYYGPGFHEPGSMLSCGVNLDAWNSLSAEHQAIVKAACAYANNASIGEFAHYNALALDTLRNEHGVSLRALPDDVWTAVAEASGDVLASVVAGDPEAEAVRNSYLASRAKLLSWSELADAGYMAVRGRVEGR